MGAVGGKDKRKMICLYFIFKIQKIILKDGILVTSLMVSSVLTRVPPTLSIQHTWESNAFHSADVFSTFMSTGVRKRLFGFVFYLST